MRTFAVGLLMLAGGCGDDDGAAEARCVSGETRPCTLADGAPGVQVCGHDFHWAETCGEVFTNTEGEVEVTPPAEPAPPAPHEDALSAGEPTAWPCPDGWTPVVDDTSGTRTCDPYPAGGAMDCPPGEAHFGGEPGCARVGLPCPMGEFAEGLADDGTVLFVRAGATGGDGTRTRPFGRIAAAMATATDGTTVALSRGRFVENVFPPEGVILRGACTSGTVIAADAMPSVMEILAGHVVVQDLTIADGVDIGLEIRGTGTMAEVRGVVVSNVERVGILVAMNGHLVGRDLVIRDTRPSAADGELGRGLVVQGGTADVVRVLVEDNREIGVSVSGAGTLQVSGAVVRNTESRTIDGLFGTGMVVQRGSALVARRLLMENNRGYGVIALHPTTTAMLTDVVVRGTRERVSDMGLGRGVDVQDGADVELRAALVDGNREVGVRADGSETQLSLEDVVVRDTSETAGSGEDGFGMHLQNGARAQVDRSIFERNRDGGIQLVRGGRATLTDVTVRDTRSKASDGTAGNGLRIQSGGQVDGMRVRVAGNRWRGVECAEAGSRLDVMHLVLEDTMGREMDGAGGRGLVFTGGAGGTVGPVRVERSRDVGVFVSGDSTDVTLTDLVVRGTSSNVDLDLGRGLNVQLGARAAVTRGLFENNRDVAVLAAEPGTVLELADATIRDTESREHDLARGRALSVVRGAMATVGPLLAENNREISVYVSEGAELELSDAVVRDTRDDGTGYLGLGLAARMDATASIYRALFERNRWAGLLVVESVALELEDVVVASTISSPQSTYGRGLEVEGGATGTVRRAVFRDNRGAGIHMRRAQLELEDVRIESTRPLECIESTCPDNAHGSGISVIRPTTQGTMRRFVVAGSGLCGVQLGMDAAVDLSQGEISGNLLGACVQVPDYDVSRLTDQVLYRDNETNLDATELPVPDALTIIVAE